MRKEYPVKQKGDGLEASHVNKLSASSEKFERLVPGSFQNMRHTDSTISFSGPEPFHIYGASVSNKKVDETDKENSGLYLIKLRWYSFEKAMWVTNADKEWILDTRMDGDPIPMEVGDKLRVYWDPQRGAFVPAFVQALRMIEITHITHATLGFDMKDHGVCLGKYVSFDTEEDWNKTYDKETILTYNPDDEEVEEVEDRYIFIGFIDQGRAGVPGQRYFGMDYGAKTCGELELPLVMVNGGTPVACVLAEDHPGCGNLFNVWIAPLWDIEMDSNNGDWDLSHATPIWDIKGCDDATVKFKAIDKRKGVPEPLKYATGLFAPRVSKANGIILEVLELDCDSPGGCYFCEAPV